MKYLLKIGHYEYLLPDNRGLSTVMETLARARTLAFDHRRRDDHGTLIGFRHGPGPAVEVRPLVGSWDTTKASDDAVDCEVLPPVREFGSASSQRQRRLAATGAAIRALPERAGGES